MPLDALINQEIRLSSGDLDSFGWLIGDGYQVTGTITNIALVPVPAAAWLYLSGLGLLGVNARRRSRT